MKHLQNSAGRVELETLRCLICQEKVTNEIDSLKAEIKSEICHRFLILSSRYLNFNCDYVRMGDHNKDSTLKTRNSNLDTNSGTKICDSCFPFAETFCLIYGQWQRLNLELNWTLNVISDLMKVKLNSTHLTKQNHIGYCSTKLTTKTRPVPKSAKYRASFVSKVKLANRKLPQLRIPRISDSKTSKKNEKFVAAMDVDGIDQDVSSPFSNEHQDNDTPKPIYFYYSNPISSGLPIYSNNIVTLTGANDVSVALAGNLHTPIMTQTPMPGLKRIAPKKSAVALAGNLHTPNMTATPALKKTEPKSLSKFKCDYCKKIFQTKSGVNNHRNKAHGEPIRINIHNCSYCGKQFDLNETAEAQLHYDEHIKEREKNCASVFLQSFMRAKAREKEEEEREMKNDDLAVPTSILQITPDINEDVTGQVDIKPEIEMVSAKLEDPNIKITPDLEIGDFETGPVFHATVKQEVITDGDETLNY